MELGAIIIVEDITEHDGSTIVAGPQQVKVAVWYQDTSRELYTRSRTQLDLGGTVEIPEHRLLSNGAETSIVSSPWVNETSDVVNVNHSLVSIDIKWRDVNENRLANETSVQLDIPGGFKIETIKHEDLETCIISGIQNHGILIGSSASVGEDAVRLQGVPILGLGLKVGKDCLPWGLIHRDLGKGATIGNEQGSTGSLVGVRSRPFVGRNRGAGATVLDAATCQRPSLSRFPAIKVSTHTHKNSWFGEDTATDSSPSYRTNECCSDNRVQQHGKASAMKLRTE
jgi:hypothetical protein